MANKYAPPNKRAIPRRLLGYDRPSRGDRHLSLEPTFLASAQSTATVMEVLRAGAGQASGRAPWMTSCCRMGQGFQCDSTWSRLTHGFTAIYENARANPKAEAQVRLLVLALRQKSLALRSLIHPTGAVVSQGLVMKPGPI